MMSTGFQIAIVAVVFVLAASKPVQQVVQKTVLTYIADTAPPEVKMKPQQQTSQGVAAVAAIVLPCRPAMASFRSLR
ncbi:MAG: hypothetical protein WDO73_32635 [Ignavibacteriota bacterium]